MKARSHKLVRKWRNHKLNQTIMKSPTKEELVNDYLYNKVHGNPLPPTCSVKECDLYSETEEPWEIWDKYGGRELEGNNNNNGVLYLFTKLKKISVNSSRFSRRVGSSGGRWEGEDLTESIFKADICVGFRRRFRYENPNSGQHGQWIMQQFSLADNGQHNDCIVLCSLKKNTRGKKKERLEHIESQPLNNGNQKEQTPAVHVGNRVIVSIPASTQPLCGAAHSLNLVHLSTESADDQSLQNQPLTSSLDAQLRNMEDECEGVDYSDWILKFSEELLKNETVSIVQESEIEMLPNENYEDVMGWERLS